MNIADELSRTQARVAQLEEENQRLRQQFPLSPLHSHRLLQMTMAAFEQNKEAYAITDLQGLLLFINAAGFDLFQVTTQEAIGKSVFDFVPADVKSTYLEIFNTIKRDGYWHGEVMLYRADGETFLAEFQGTLLREKNDEPLALLATIRDISEAKRVEQSFREQESLQKIFIEHAPAAVAMFDTQMRYIATSRRWLTDYHLTDRRIIGRSHYDVFPEITDAWKAAHRRALAGETIRCEEDVFVRSDGTDDYLRWEIVPWYKHNGAIGGIIIFTEDITQRKEAEKSLRQREQQLEILRRISLSMNSVLDVPTILRTLVSAATALVDAHSGAAGLYINDCLLFKEYLSGGEIFPIHEEFPERYGIPGWVMHTRAPYLTNDAEHDPHVTQHHRRRFNFNRAISIPIFHRDGQLLGCFEMHRRKEQRPFEEVDITFLQGLAATAAVALENARTITELQQTQHALRDSEHLLRSVLDTNPMGIFVKDADGRFLLVNKTFAESFQLPMEQIVGQRHEDLHASMQMNPEDMTYWKNVDREVIATQQPQVTVQQIQHPGVNNCWFRTQILPLNLLNGEQCVLVITENITQQKAAEDALDRERAYLSTAIEILPFPILFFSPNMELIRGNTAAKEFFHVNAPQDLAEFHLLTPDTRIPIPHHRWPNTRANNGEILPSMEVLLVTPDLHEIPLLIHAAPIHISNQIVASIVALQDISELKQTDQAKNEFLAVLSHELMTPLTSILGWTEAARNSSAVMPQALEIIERNSQRQRRILDDLLDVSRILHGKLFLRPEVVELWSLVEQCTEDLSLDFQKRRLSIELHAPNAPLLIHADPARIRQVITNLLVNASKFSQAGGVITLSAHHGDQRAIFSVQDTGCGIPPEVLNTLFRPFQQADRSEATGGLGLGLALIKGIVELHNGTVHAESPGRECGSTFTVTLPLHRSIA